MKAIRILSLLLTICLLTLSTRGQSGPEDGIYFIVNLATGRALTPVDGGVHSNTRLKKFNKSGMQKWTIKKKVTTAKNGKKSISYTIKSASSGFYLRPHHVPANGNAILANLDPFCNYSIMAVNNQYLIKNLKMGGDLMYSKNTGFEDDEPWFGPDESDENYRWKFIPATD